MSVEERRTLAWHETLELHELVAFQSNGLMKLKMMVKKIDDPELKRIYIKAIKDIELNIRELLPFYSAVPVAGNRNQSVQPGLGFYSGDLLGLLKTSVRNYSIAITETATPVLRKTLTNHLLRGIKGHEQIFNYMYRKGYYPAYDLGQLLMNDVKNANKALSMDY
ncbi:spore coat protein [Metabacillus fastidiosus]|uniref:spore coat protein n=1 Tax=Metabacillus fastidiosus TaxID=1458 RepID=UPI002DBDA897|nr:spore coat protein [Metabacillus fastidiosus]MEC2074941.1 spore coat protein [Metabacillus fastidiosus]